MSINPFENFFNKKEVAEETLKNERKELRDISKLEHLKAGVRPIMACIGTPEHFEKYPAQAGELVDENGYWPLKKSTRNIDYYGNPLDLAETDNKNAGRNSYVISPVDTHNKLSREYYNCTGLVVASRDKKTGEDISFLTHQDPHFFLKRKSNTSKFERDLRERFGEIIERSEEGTIDAVVFGGNYFRDNKKHQDDYRRTISFLSKEVLEELNIEPYIITGPKTGGGRDDAYYDNSNRRLYIMRSYVGQSETQGYRPSDIDEQETAWLEQKE